MLSKPCLEPDTLWRRIREQTRHALACSALQPIETEQRVVEEGGVRFLVRVASNLARKDRYRKRQGDRARKNDKERNPFLPPDGELTVGDISQTHLGVLNKFNVIDHHLLIVTRRFEHQETLLTLQDFEALWACMAGFEGLGFYNGGVVAGASQPHKHLQMVPLPLSNSGPLMPIEPLVAAAETTRVVDTVASLPFRHVLSRLKPSLMADPLAAAGETLERYRAMLASAGIEPVEDQGQLRQSAPYNLLVTRRWMLVVPRAREFFATISVNALGFAGSLFVRDEKQLDAAIRHGPVRILREVSGA